VKVEAATDLNEGAETMDVTSNGRTISMGKAIAYFALPLVINSAGNVLTLVTSAKIHPSFLGAAYWSAAEANLGTAFHWNLFWAFLVMGFLTAVLNAILIHHWDWKRIAGNMVFMVPFSALIQEFEDVLKRLFQEYDGEAWHIIEDKIVNTAFSSCWNNQVKTAKMLGLSRNVLRNLLSRYNLLPNKNEIV